MFTPAWAALFVVFASGIILFIADFDKDPQESNRLKRWGHGLALAFATLHVAMALHPDYRHMSLAYLGGVPGAGQPGAAA